jgi:hypothetical protein
MLDIPKLGLRYLDNALSHIAEVSEDSEEYEDAFALISGLKALVGPTILRLALTETATDGNDHVSRERDVQRSLMEVEEVRKMA